MSLLVALQGSGLLELSVMETAKSGKSQHAKPSRVARLRLMGGAVVGIGLAVGAVLMLGGGASGAAVATTAGVLTLVMWGRNRRTTLR